ncbi:hypothetical protein OSB04_015858 [Centaurea solstitialis]|uniref:Tf2-1-like SH3-like domain-containing protein n=1 Tax=Centaurea solstitialis TaxID=347529 RepID=A0AA38TJT5_9ASTR|nr:hypothetical protein OSB04_015858 [Centaurea solstitialis]
MVKLRPSLYRWVRISWRTLWHILVWLLLRDSKHDSHIWVVYKHRCKFDFDGIIKDFKIPLRARGCIGSLQDSIGLYRQYSRSARSLVFFFYVANEKLETYCRGDPEAELREFCECTVESPLEVKCRTRGSFDYEGQRVKIRTPGGGVLLIGKRIDETTKVVFDGENKRICSLSRSQLFKSLSYQAKWGSCKGRGSSVQVVHLGGAPILFVRKEDGPMRMYIEYLLDDRSSFRVPSCEGDKRGHAGDCVQIKVRMFRVRSDDVRITNALAMFMDLTNRVSTLMLDRSVIVFTYDILIYSKSKGEHVKLLVEVLETLRKERLYSKFSKCDSRLQDVMTAVLELIKSSQVDAVKETPVQNRVPSSDRQPKQEAIPTLEDMLRACVLDFGGTWDIYLSVAGFLYHRGKEYIRFSMKGKLGLRHIGPFKVIARVGKVACRIELPPELSKIKMLRNKGMGLVKVQWDHRKGSEWTWESNTMVPPRKLKGRAWLEAPINSMAQLNYA